MKKYDKANNINEISGVNPVFVNKFVLVHVKFKRKEDLTKTDYKNNIYNMSIKKHIGYRRSLLRMGKEFKIKRYNK